MLRLLCALLAPLCLVVSAMSQRTPEVRLDSGPAGSANSAAPQIAASGSAIYVAWLERPSARNEFDICFNRSLDGGATWLAADVRVNQVPLTSGNYKPSIAASGSAVYVSWIDLRNGYHDTYVNRSLDRGTTWLSEDVRVMTAPRTGAIPHAGAIADDLRRGRFCLRDLARPTERCLQHLLQSIVGPGDDLAQRRRAKSTQVRRGPPGSWPR